VNSPDAATPKWLAKAHARPASMVIHACLFIVVVAWLVPSVGLLLTSFRSPADISSSGWWTILAHPHLTLDNYRAVLNSLGFQRAFLNSVVIAVPATVLPVGIAALAAYGFAWGRFPGRNAVFMCVVALMVVPLQTAFVPALRIFGALGISGSYGAIWIAHTAFGLPFAIFLLRSFFALLPHEILESARIDGASEFRVFRSIVLPLSSPALASMTVLQFLWVWNDLLMALVFVQDDSKQPLTVAAARMLGTYGQEFNLLSASAVLLMVVPVAVFVLLQRHFVRGIVAGAIK